MPKYISDNGKWEPAKEKAAITNAKGEPEIYEGLDREALKEMKAGNVESRHFWEDTEWVNRVRQLHNMSMEEYMKSVGFDANTTRAEFEKKVTEVNTHQDLPRKPGTKFASGGKNTAGGGSLEGDFGDLSDAKAKVR